MTRDVAVHGEAYVFTIVVVATWGVPPLEPATEQSFRTVYFLRLILGNVVGLTLGAFLAATAANFGLRIAGKATDVRGAIGGAVLGAAVGAVTAGSCPLLLLISSHDPNWAWIMIQRSVLVGGLMGLTNGFFAGLVIVYFHQTPTRLEDQFVRKECPCAITQQTSRLLRRSLSRQSPSPPTSNTTD